MTTYIGTSDGDDITGTTGDDTFRMFQGGDDFVQGLEGNDVFQFGATLNAADHVEGDAGNDTLILNGDYSGGVTFGSGTISGIETLQLRSGFDYNFTTDNGNVASGERLTVDASAVDSGHTLTFDGSAENDGAFKIIGGAGADTLTGGVGDDVFDLSRGGEDTATGGIGNDVFIMGASLDAGDDIDGGFDFGARANVLRLDGDYSGGVTFGTTTVQNIYTFQFDAGHDYKITVDNATFASGPTVTIQGAQLGAGDDLTFDASASDANFHFFAGAGNDTITGGTAFDIFDLSKGGNDTVSGGDLRDIFRFGTTLNGNDTIDGGAGTDTVDMTGMGGTDAIFFGTTTFTSVEILHLAAGQSYALVMADGNVASGASMLIDASALGAGDSLVFSGGAETNGFFTIRGGAGNDLLTGGQQADIFNLTKGGNDTAHGGTGTDTFNMGGALTAADAIDGGGGADTINLDGDYSSGLTLGATTLTSVETITFATGHAYSISTNDATVASGTVFTVDASALTGGGDHIAFDGSAETDGRFAITSGAAGFFTGGALADTFNFTAATGTVSGNGGTGNDTFSLGANLRASDAVNGGDDNDTVIVSGDYSAGITFTATTLTNVENLTLGGGHDYKFTLNDGNIASGGSLTVNMVALGTGHTLTLDASAETDGAVIVTAGAAFTASDSFIVGTGQSALILNGDYSAGLTFGATTAENLGDISLGDGFSYNITLNDATAASGMAVDASALTAGHTLTLNAAAETDVTLDIFGGAGNDTITGGQAGDLINIGQGGNDTVHAGSGANEIDIGGALTAADSIDGGGNGGTYIAMAGDYSGANALVLGATTVTHVAELQLGGGDSYDITTNDATVASGALLSVDAGSLGASDFLIFNGSAETDGSFAIIGGAGDDTFEGGNGADLFIGGTGEDTFKYTAAAQSTGTAHDTITDFASGTDVFNFGGIVGGFDGTVTGSVSTTSFDTDIGNAFNDSVILHGNHAWLVSATGGDLAGHDFLVVDTNNNAHYDGGTDFVIDITGHTGTMTASDFI